MHVIITGHASTLHVVNETGIFRKDVYKLFKESQISRT